MTILAYDGPLVTFDFGIVLWWHQVRIALQFLFDPRLGLALQYTAVISAIWLTIVRIRHFNRLMKDMKAPPPDKQDE